MTNPKYFSGTLGLYFFYPISQQEGFIYSLTRESMQSFNIQYNKKNSFEEILGILSVIIWNCWILPRNARQYRQIGKDKRK